MGGIGRVDPIIPNIHLLSIRIQNADLAENRVNRLAEIQLNDGGRTCQDGVGWRDGSHQQSMRLHRKDPSEDQDQSK